MTATDLDNIASVIEELKHHGHSRAEERLARITPRTPEVQGHYEYALGLFHRLRADLNRAAVHLTRASELSKVHGLTRLSADAALQLAYLRLAALDGDAALALLHEAQSALRSMHDTAGEIAVKCNVLNVLLDLNHVSDATALMHDLKEQIDALPRDDLNPNVYLSLLNSQGRLFEKAGLVQESTRAYAQGYHLALKQQSTEAQEIFLHNLCEALIKQGRAETALKRIEGYRTGRDLPASDLPTGLLTLYSSALSRTGQHAQAEQVIRQAIASAQQDGDRETEITARGVLAEIQLAQGRHADAQTTAEQALRSVPDDDHSDLKTTLLWLSATASEAIDPQQSITHLKALIEINRQVNRALIDQYLQIAHTASRLENAEQLLTLEKQLRLDAEATIQRQVDALEKGRLYDQLTGLPNRVLLHAQVAQRTAQSGEFLLVTLDVNRFQLVNDMYGHDAADDMLRALADRLRGALAPGEMVARVGGDEFGLLLSHPPTGETLTAHLRRVVSTVSQPLPVGTQVLRVSASVGAARWPADATNPEALRRASELALLDAKAQGENLMFYDAGAHAHAGLEGALAHALDRGEYELHYQPLVDTQARRILSAEALLRWNSPERGLQSPGTFMPILERGDHIVEVGAWALREACRAAQQWGGVRVAVNLSARQFASPDLLGQVRAALRDTGLPPALLELEITESLMMQNPDRAARILEALRADGVRVMLDDFGTGYSSLAYLARFPLSGLKIDRSFIHDLAQDPRGHSAAIVRAMVGLSRDMGLELVAEGVETLQHLQLLQREGIHVMQGYYFARPTRDWRPAHLPAPPDLQ
ncbi:EAL domain-containing protein (plasmid) [Deinococcus taeanensis]|uniref:putative bifunctional diguanylate cyclase/phosphodiesterase n=1 Tax=Deinococcus taeanensis TaxID=2737050 RepID=UPI001CDB8835|nr:EAL domain-containing protein [Deinococcus taeanensis]UBV45117.1 EAL domain-containing protein [Deinococcus taeanensis]